MMLLWVTGGLLLLAGGLLTYLLKPHKSAAALYRVRLHCLYGSDFLHILQKARGEIRKHHNLQHNMHSYSHFLNR